MRSFLTGIGLAAILGIAVGIAYHAGRVTVRERDALPSLSVKADPATPNPRLRYRPADLPMPGQAVPAAKG